MTTTIINCKENPVINLSILIKSKLLGQVLDIHLPVINNQLRTIPLMVEAKIRKITITVLTLMVKATTT